MFHTVINGLSNILGGAQPPRIHAIVFPLITQLGSNMHVGISNLVRLQFKILINIFDHGHSIVINDEDFINITHDIGVVYISFNVKFELDPHVRVRWELVVSHMSHTVISMLAGRRFVTFQVIEGMKYDSFLTSIITLRISRDRRSVMRPHYGSPEIGRAS